MSSSGRFGFLFEHRPAPAGRGELAFVAGWTLVLVAASLVPIVAGYASAPEGWRFTGFHTPGLNDYQGYMSWIRQAQDGHLLFVDKFTTEPSHRISFHPLFWLIGAVAGLTGLSVLGLWYAVNILSLAVMVWGIHRFSVEMTDSPGTRSLALVLATTASGLGWLLPGPAGRSVIERPIDLWLEEANQFRAIGSSFFTLTLALGLMLLVAVRLLSYFRDGHLRDAVVSGLLALLLAFVHPYDVVTLYAVLGVWALLAGRSCWPGLVVSGAIAAPGLLYGFLAVRFDPVLSQLDLSMEMPPLAAWIVGWGLPLLLAALAPALPSVWRDHPRLRLLLIWAAVNLLLLLLPIDFRRKFMWGFHLILCLPAAMTIRALVRGLTGGLARRPAARRAVAGVLAGLAAAFMTVGSLQFLLVQLGDRSLGRYLPEEAYRAFRYIDEHCGEDEVVIAGPALAGFIPGWTGTVGYWGHWALTVDLERKQGLVYRLLTPGEAIDRGEVRDLLAGERVRYVVVDSASVKMSSGAGWPIAEDALPVAPFTRPVFHGDGLVILEVRPELLAAG